MDTHSSLGVAAEIGRLDAVDALSADIRVDISSKARGHRDTFP